MHFKERDGQWYTLIMLAAQNTLWPWHSMFWIDMSTELFIPDRNTLKAAAGPILESYISISVRHKSTAFYCYQQTLVWFRGPRIASNRTGTTSDFGRLRTSGRRCPDVSRRRDNVDPASCDYWVIRRSYDSLDEAGIIESSPDAKVTGRFVAAGHFATSRSEVVAASSLSPCPLEIAGK